MFDYIDEVWQKPESLPKLKKDEEATELLNKFLVVQKFKTTNGIDETIERAKIERVDGSVSIIGYLKQSSG